MTKESYDICLENTDTSLGKLFLSVKNKTAINIKKYII